MRRRESGRGLPLRSNLPVVALKRWVIRNIARAASCRNSKQIERASTMMLLPRELFGGFENFTARKRQDMADVQIITIRLLVDIPVILANITIGTCDPQYEQLRTLTPQATSSRNAYVASIQ